MIHRCTLPDAITLPTGETLKPVIGGHLENIPFLTIVDVTKNGWMQDLPTNTNEKQAIIAEAKKRKLKFRCVSVLSRNLRNKLDLHHRPYTGNVWIFVQV